MENIISRLDCCRICRSDNFKILFEKYGYGIARCRSCGLTFLNFSPDDEFFKNYYAEDFFKDPGTKHGFSDYEGEVENLRKTFRERIELLRNYKPQGTLLDIGCATGAFMESAREFWPVYGVEISEYACRLARAKGLAVFQGTLRDKPYQNLKFDVVTLWDTLEHLADPLGTLQELAQITNEGAIVAVTTGDVGSLVSRISGKFWHLYNIPQHLSFFDQRSITGLFEQSGFVVKEINYPSLNFSLDYLMFRFVTFYKIAYLRPFYNFLKQRKRLNRNLKINLFDVMLVVAQRK